VASDFVHLINNEASYGFGYVLLIFFFMGMKLEDEEGR